MRGLAPHSWTKVYVDARQLPAAALTSWGSVRSGLETMNRAFGM